MTKSSAGFIALLTLLATGCADDPTSSYHLQDEFGPNVYGNPTTAHYYNPALGNQFSMPSKQLNPYTGGYATSDEDPYSLDYF